VIKKVVVLGAGAVGKYISYIFSHYEDMEIFGFTDSDVEKWGQEIDGKPILGADDEITGLYNQGLRHAIIGAALPEIRRKLRTLALEAGFELINAIHPTAMIPPGVRLGKGIVAAAGVIMSHDPMIEDNVWLGLGAVVGHDTQVGQDGLVGGRAAVGADVEIGQGVLVGFASVVGRNVRIGDSAIVGSGANVVHDVPARAVVVGNPAKTIKYRNV
jgi:sugar O-acyltransferase (sialic acid O-acetyltransferase NeuD family)